LILSFLGIALLVGSVALLVGIRLLYGAFLNEATTRVRLDLNAAREIYLSRIKLIRTVLNLTSIGPVFQSEVERLDLAKLTSRLKGVGRQADLDFLGVVARDGRNICRIGSESSEQEVANPIASIVLKKQVGISGTMVLSHDFLFAEDPELAERARITLMPTKMAQPAAETEYLSGMALVAAVPIVESNRFLGVLYGGVLLNQNHEIVDRVRDTVFQHEVYNGRSIGTATIFLNNIRISTNVLNPDGTRSVGTVASEEVTKRVLTDGKKWTDRAFVVDDWYITAYEPIEDVFGRRVGMLYAGVLEAKYGDVRSKALLLFILITAGGMGVAGGLGYVIASRISQPVSELIEASAQVSRGNLSPQIRPVSKSEIGVLQKTFMEMLASIRQRDRLQKAESETRLLQFEKQASIGKLAGGVAHEINNPLTGIFTFTHMLLKRKDLQEDVRSDLETISNETERVRKIVKGLLEFSRQTELEREPTDVNLLCRSTVALVENQALIKNVTLSLEQGEGLSSITLDPNQMKSVLLNLIINALDATAPGGQITVSTGIGISVRNPGQKGIEIICKDTGCGIAPENLDKVFDPFFTTKEVGQGTGLGLSVSFGIVERHGGTIHVQSKPGRGSAFTIWLPIEEQSAKNENTGR
jgi:two-component system, NtrC family, sensor kinase